MASKASTAPTAVSGNIAPELISKESELRLMMRAMNKVLVAYSGGVDSSYLAYIAHNELGDGARCVLGISASVAAAQRIAARKFAKRHNLNLSEIETGELSDPSYIANPANRCYFCKSELYSKLRAFAERLGFDHVLDGTNFDDLRDVRPGRTAATENEVKSPLADAGMSKAEIRELSRLHGLETSELPSSPCLSSRIAYGVPVTIERLSKIERAEDYLRRNGFREFRVRVHGELARIEIAKSEMPRFAEPEMFARAGAELRNIGFKYVTLDLDGFRSGSMNKAFYNLFGEEDNGKSYGRRNAAFQGQRRKESFRSDERAVRPRGSAARARSGPLRGDACSKQGDKGLHPGSNGHRTYSGVRGVPRPAQLRARASEGRYSIRPGRFSRRS
jgi:uncharacterized protein